MPHQALRSQNTRLGSGFSIDKAWWLTERDPLSEHQAWFRGLRAQIVCVMRSNSNKHQFDGVHAQDKTAA